MSRLLGYLLLADLLAAVFIVLRLTGLICWAWLWVLSPIWVPAIIFAVILIRLCRKD